MNQRLEQLAHLPEGRLLWQYSLPAVVGMVVNAAYNIVDRIYIGHGINSDAIAGLTTTFPVMNVATALGVLVGAGASSRISIHLGANEHGKAQRILGNAMLMTIVIGIAYVSVFAFFLEDILMAFGASRKTLPYAYDYMVWLLPGLLLTNLAFSFNNIQRASGYPRRAMMTMIISALINIILTPVFLFGFDMGIRGAAIATDIAMAAALVFVMWHFVNKKSVLHFVKGCFRSDYKIMWSIITIGAAPALVNAAASLINMLINTSLRDYGSDNAVGAAGIFTTYTSLIVVIVIGICQGMQPILGYNYGSGRVDRLKKTYLLACLGASVLCIAGTFVSLTWPEIIARIFTKDEELIRQTVFGLKLSTTAFFVVGFQIVTSNFFQSIGLAGQSILLSLSRQVIFLIPLLLVLPGVYGLAGVWISFPISDVLATIVTVAFIIHRLRIITRNNQNQVFQQHGNNHLSRHDYRTVARSETH